MPEPHRLDLRQLERAAAELEFPAESLEKVLRLVELLDGLRSHPYLNGRLALKGGTALNLFLLDLPRLSVDIDLNYIGALDRKTMLEERPRIEQAVRDVCRRCGLHVRRLSDEYAGGKCVLRYDRAAGGTGTLALDLNFLLRTPLWPVASLDAPELMGFKARGVLVLDLHELAGGKLAALFGRSASRDVYDMVRLFEQPALDPEKLRLAFVVYGAMSRRDFRGISVDEIEIDPQDATSELLPLLRGDLGPSAEDVESWCCELAARCIEGLSAVLPYESRETEFLDAIQERGEIRPELLTSDPALQERIRSHPALLWKALNVKRHRGKMTQGGDEPGLAPQKEG